MIGIRILLFIDLVLWIFKVVKKVEVKTAQPKNTATATKDLLDNLAKPLMPCPEVQPWAILTPNAKIKKLIKVKEDDLKQTL